MLNVLDRLIERILDTGWTATPPPAKPGFYFTVPDEEWKKKVMVGAGVRLNIYLYEVRENVNMRRSQWDVIPLANNNGGSVLSKPPAYFDCHYLISAWSAAEDSEAINPVLDEHQTLSEALRVIMRNPEVTPINFVPIPGLAPGSLFARSQVYLTVAQPEAPRVLNDFWSTMKLPWRPAIQIVATAPLDLLLDSQPFPPMTTFIQLYGVAEIDPVTGLLTLNGSPDEFIQIGGWVINDNTDAPIAGAIVQRIGNSNEVLEEAKTDSQGRYTLTGMRRGTHIVRASAPGVASKTRVLDIPNNPQADYILALS